MAKEPKPTALSKTIDLSGGMAENVAEFRIEQPSMQYMENVRYLKSGRAEKTLPMTALANPGLSDLPAALSTQDEKLFIVADEGAIKTYEDGAWVTTTGNRFAPHTNKRLSTTPASPGAAEYCFADGPTWRIVAYEQRRPNSENNATTPLIDLVVEVYTLEGTFLARNVYEDRRTPQAIYDGTGVPVIYGVDNAAGATSGNLYRMYWTGSSFTSSTLTQLIEVDYDSFNLVYPANRETMRYGFCEDGGGAANYAIGASSSQGILAYVDNIPNAEVQKVNSAGQLTGSPVALAGASLYVKILACAVDDDVACVMFAAMDVATSPDSYDVYLNYYDVSGATPTLHSSTVVATGDGWVVNGSFSFGFNELDGHWAYTAVGRDPTQENATQRDELSFIEAGTSVGYLVPSVGSLGRHYGHRLCSDIAYDTDKQEAVCVIEQWSVFEPQSTVGGPFEHLGAMKPVTPLLVEFITGSQVKVLSAFDTILSKAVNDSSGEQTNHLNSLYYDDQTWTYRYLNRVVLQPEDPIFFEVLSGSNKYKGILFPGEYEGRLHEVEMIGYNAPPVGARHKTSDVEPYGKGVVVAGSIPSYYDGRVYGELSPLDQPEIVYVYNSDNDADSLVMAYGIPAGGTNYRSFQVVCGFTDAQGYVHRSAPSLPIFVTRIDAGVAGNANENWRRLGFVPPKSGYGTKRDSFVEVYVGIESANPSLAAAQSFTNTGDAFDTFEITFIDQIVSSNPVRFSEVLYTTGFVLPADPWPAVEQMVATSSRLFGVKEGNLYYSKNFEENITPEWNSTGIINVGQSRALTAIGKIDDKVLLFTKNEIFSLYGNGPDNTGSGGDFILDTLIAPFGCDDPESVLETPDGLMFFSSRTKKFQMITRDLQVITLGDPVEDLTDGTLDVTGAFIIPEENEARWYTAGTGPSEWGVTADETVVARPPLPRYSNGRPNGACFVYNYDKRKWSVLTNQVAVLATAYNNGGAIMDTISLVSVTSLEWGGPDTAIASMKMRTPWVRIANLQNYGRIDELVFLGEYLSDWADTWGGGHEAGDCQVTLRYDYEENSAGDVYRFRANAGDFGTDRMQFSCHPGRPKCQAIQVEIEEIATEKLDDDEPTYSQGRGFALSGMDIIYTPKAGLGTKSTPQETTK